MADLADGTKVMRCLKDYLSFVVEAHRTLGPKPTVPDGFKYCCMEDFILSAGSDFIPKKLPEDIPRGVIKMCYQNTFDLCMRNPELIYCEGYALGSIMPVMHAWASTKTREVIDATWPEVGSEYVGLPFKFDYVRECMLESETYGVIDNWGQGYPLLRGDVEGVVEGLSPIPCEV